MAAAWDLERRGAARTLRRVADSRERPTLFQDVLPRDLRTSLLATQLLAFATLARSVAYGYWFTIGVSTLMIVGALAAMRSRTWGVALTFATATTFTAAALLGIAPAWFLGVGAVGALPFLLSSESMARFDRQATTWLAALASGAGAALAVAWNVVAWSVFVTVPALAPTRFVSNGLAATAVLALGAVALVAQRERERRLRVAEPQPLRIAEVASSQARAAPDSDEEDDEVADAPRARMRG